jgi:hypothetical protein
MLHVLPMHIRFKSLSVCVLSFECRKLDARVPLKMPNTGPQDGRREGAGNGPQQAERPDAGRDSGMAMAMVMRLGPFSGHRRQLSLC